MYHAFKKLLGAGSQLKIDLFSSPSTASVGNELGSTGGLGAKNGATVTATETVGTVHRTTLTLTNTPITMTDAAGVVAHGGVKVYDLPQGAIAILGATANLTVVESGGINADFDGDFSLGTVVASNNATLSSTEANIIPSTATPQAVASATTAKGQSTGAVYLDGTTTAPDVFLNFLVDDADQDGGGTLTVSGTIQLVWINLGDY